MRSTSPLARPFSTCLFVGIALLAGGPESRARAQDASFVITLARLADGSGNPLRTATVRVTGDTIVEVGEVTPRPGDEAVDGTGLILAPGFIDPHNHSTDGIETDPDA